ncbi:hypothetical protein [Nocardioides xinjiangensis]|uniref:hypothetical protein n=1 Tax=Nocardioides xinjiangensis TaxID=2817376 RepID=UPI001B3043EF|nr:MULTISPECIES: hypothetical protein [unclassified Nocardioides]
MPSLRLLAASIATSSVLLAPTAAHAERLVTEDAVGDAQSIRSDAEEEIFDPAPEHTAADITRTVVVHGARRVRVQVRYRDLERTSPRAAYVKLRTPGRRFDLRTSRNAPGAGTWLTRGQREDDVHCPGLRSSVDGARDQLTVTVPSACLGRPAWVQVGVLSVVAEADAGSGLDEPHLAYVDDAHMVGGFEDHSVRLGPKVFPG